MLNLLYHYETFCKYHDNKGFFMFAQIATFVYRQILASRHKVSFRFYTKLRALILKFTDPLITLKFRGYTLTMPFSHTIFLNQKLYPTYDMQLHKIAHYIAQKMGFIHIVDVGANIGDTAVFMDSPQARFLLIEGEKSYNTLIERNFSRHYGEAIRGGDTPKLLIENSFITDTQDSYTITRYDGSAKLQHLANPTDSKDSPQNLTFHTLDSLIAKHHFSPNFIKIDTDGFDFKVLRSATHTLQTYKSALFFEWDLFFLQAQNENPTSIFDSLKSLGYAQLLIFDNFGNLLIVLDSGDIPNLTLLLDYRRKSNKHIYYYDVLALHKDTPLDAWECAKLF